MHPILYPDWGIEDLEKGGVMYDGMGCFSELFRLLLGRTSLKSLKPKKN